MSLLTKKTITLDITSKDIRLMQIKGKRIDRWISAPIEQGLVKDGIVTDPGRLGEIIKSTMQSSNIEGKKVVASISGLYSVSRIVDLPQSNGHSREEAMSEMAAEMVPLPLDEVYVSWQVIGSKGNGQQALFFGTPTNIIDAEMGSLKSAHLKPYGLNIKSMALFKLVDTQQALMVNIEEDSADILLVADSLPQVVRTVRRSLDIDMEEWVKDIAVNIDQTILFYNTRFQGRHLAIDIPFYLTGQLSKDPSVVTMLEDLTGFTPDLLPVPLKCPPDFPISQYAVNIGLAVKQPSTMPTIDYEKWEVEDVEQ